MLTNEEIAEHLLRPLWIGLASRYKKDQATRIWDQFESNIQSAAGQPTIAAFLTRICERLPITIYQEDVASMTGVVQAGQDRHVLTQLRKETTALVLLVRIWNEERKEQPVHEKLPF